MKMSLSVFIFLAIIDAVTGSNVLATLLGFGDTKVDPDLMTNAMTAAGIVQGALLMFNPILSLKMYGTKEDTLYSRVHAEGTGAAVLTFGVACFCVFNMKLDTFKTFGFSSLVWTTQHIRMLARQDPKKLGASSRGNIVWLIFSLAAIHACFTSAAYTKKLMMAGHSLFAFHNIMVLVKPKVVRKIYGYKKMKLSNDEKEWLIAFAYENLAVCVFGLNLAAGVEAHKSLGFGSLVVVAHCAHSFVGNFNLGLLGSFLMFFWMVFHASYAANFISCEVGYAMASIIVAVAALKLTSVPTNFEFPQLASEELTK